MTLDMSGVILVFWLKWLPFLSGHTLFITIFTFMKIYWRIVVFKHDFFRKHNALNFCLFHYSQDYVFHETCMEWHLFLCFVYNCFYYYSSNLTYLWFIFSFLTVSNISWYNFLFLVIYIFSRTLCAFCFSFITNIGYADATPELSHLTKH